MRYLHQLIILALLSLLTTTQITAQGLGVTTGSGGPMYMKLMNGSNAVMMPTAGTDKVEISLYIKNGSVYENDSLSGISNLVGNILGERIKAGLRKGRTPVPYSVADFSYYTTSEHTVYRLVLPESYTRQALTLLRDSVLLNTFDQPEIDSALAQVTEQIQANEQNPALVFEENLKREIFRQDYFKTYPLGDTTKFQFIHLESVQKHYNRYYVGANAVVAVTGRFSVSNFQNHYAQVMNTLEMSEFDPETITKIIDFRPMMYNNQFIVNDETVTRPEFHICWQFPAPYAFQQGSYMAYLFSSMLNDKNNYLHRLASKMGCHKLSFQYEPNSFNGVMRVVVQPDKKLLIPTYQWLIKEMARINYTLVNEGMINAGKVIFKQEFERLQKGKEYVDFTVKFWPYKEESYFANVLDSVLDVNEKELKRFVSEYMIENAHVSGLRINEADRRELNVDSQFTTLTEAVGSYVFTYRPNITDLEGPENLRMLRNLQQWLQANPDVNLKVNGFADKSEYNRATDDTIMRFIDSIPTFRKVMPDYIKKGYLRPEMMRAIKIIKYLYDNGISAERLSGTSMMARDSNDGNELANMKCTVLLDKTRQLVSVYEYHYGKKKEE